MSWSDIVTLMAVTNTVDDYGDIVETPTEKQVFANKKSVTRSEYYQALSAGLKPEVLFEVRSADYEEEKTLKYNDKTYNIMRVYTKNGEISELICKGVI